MVKIHRMSKKIDHSRHMACVTMGRALDEALLWADIHVYNHDQGIGWCWCSSLVTYQPHGVCEWCRTMNVTHMSVIAPTVHGLPIVAHAICLLWSIFLLTRWILTIPTLSPQSVMMLRLLSIIHRLVFTARRGDKVLRPCGTLTTLRQGRCGDWQVSVSWTHLLFSPQDTPYSGTAHNRSLVIFVEYRSS